MKLHCLFPAIVIGLTSQVIQGSPIQEHQECQSEAFGVEQKESTELTPSYLVASQLGANDRRYKTFTRALEMLEARGGKTIVETGTCRHCGEDAIPKGDVSLVTARCVHEGCSSILFSRWAAVRPERQFYSVDIDPRSIDAPWAVISKYYPRSVVVCQDAVRYLKDLPFTIDLLYLDSFDVTVHEPLISQTHHLAELIAGLDKLHENTLVLIDDCEYQGGGKCPLVDYYLRNHGWTLIEKGYQQLYARTSTL